MSEFDFKAHYGDIGEGYIEGHHSKTISEMAEDEETKVEDIALCMLTATVCYTVKDHG